MCAHSEAQACLRTDDPKHVATSGVLITALLFRRRATGYYYVALKVSPDGMGNTPEIDQSFRINPIPL